MFTGAFQMHPGTVLFTVHELVHSQVIKQFRHAHAILMVLLLQEGKDLGLVRIHESQERNVDDDAVAFRRRSDRVGDGTSLGIALLSHQRVDHRGELALVAGGIVGLLEKFHQRRILLQFHKKCNLPIKERLDVMRFRQQDVVDTDKFLLVLDRLQEKAIIVQERHVLVFR